MSARQAGPSGWAVDRFGQHAAPLMELVPTAIAAAADRQIGTHAASGLESLQAYGGAWPVQYEELVNHLGDLRGAVVVRPVGYPAHLVVVNGRLLLPFRYADNPATPLTDQSVPRRLNKTSRELLAQYGPRPDFVQPTLDGFPIDDPGAGAGPLLPGGMEPEGTVLVYFAANADAGLLDVGWGEAALLHDGGGLQWTHTEQLYSRP